MTVRDADVSRLTKLSGLGSLPYRSFNNAPVRRAPAPPPSAEPAVEVRPTATVLTLPAAAAEAAPLLRVIAGMGGLAARPLQVVRPAAEPAPLPAFAMERPATPARQAPPAGFSLLARAMGEDASQVPIPPAPRPAPPADAGPTTFPLLNAALSAGGGSPWR